MIIIKEDYAEALTEAAKKGRLVSLFVKNANTQQIHEFPRSLISATHAYAIEEFGTVIFKPEIEYPPPDTGDDQYDNLRYHDKFWATISNEPSNVYPVIVRLHIHY